MCFKAVFCNGFFLVEDKVPKGTKLNGVNEVGAEKHWKTHYFHLFPVSPRVQLFELIFKTIQQPRWRCQGSSSSPPRLHHIASHGYWITLVHPSIYLPGTQMTLVFIAKGLVLEGWSPKIEDKQVPGRCRSYNHQRWTKTAASFWCSSLPSTPCSTWRLGSFVRRWRKCC